MNMKLTGEKSCEKIASMSSQLKVMYVRKQDISDDADDVIEEDDIQENGISFVESLAMLDKVKKCSFLDDKSQMMLSTLTRKFEDLQIKFNKSILQLIIYACYVLCISLEMKKSVNNVKM